MFAVALLAIFAIDGVYSRLVASRPAQATQ